MRHLFFFACLTLVSCSPQSFTVDNKMFDLSKPNDLGLQPYPHMKTTTIFKPQGDDMHYNHSAIITMYKGYLYTQWQTSKRDEDSPDTHVVYSRSLNGQIWSKPIILTEPSDDKCTITTSGGWLSNGDSLIAFINVWKTDTINKIKTGYTAYKTSHDGITWSDMQPVTTIEGDTLHGIIEQDLRVLPNKRILSAVHLTQGLQLKPCYTDDPSGVRGWIIGKMKNLKFNDKNKTRELEPSWFMRDDNEIVMIMRDQNSTFKKLASVSTDYGATWSDSHIIDTPDSRSKQSAGNLSDGRAFMIYNPSNEKRRLPLALVMSDDGYHFDKAYLLRSGNTDDLPKQRKVGKYKRMGYSYPKSIVVGNKIYCVYATNKEDIEVTEILFP